MNEGAIAAGRYLTIANLIQQRQAARQQCDFAAADDIRDRLATAEISVVTNRMAKSVDIDGKSLRSEAYLRRIWFLTWSGSFCD